MKSLTFIFDFDGTIADTHQKLIEISNQLADKFNFNKILDEEIHSLKDKTAKEIIRHLHVPILKIPAIVTAGKKQFYTEMDTIEPIDGIVHILHQLKCAGHTLGILSSNSLENINIFLKKYQLDIFDFIYTTSKVWSKHTTLRKMFRTHDLDRQLIIYVGDETRDIDAAHKLSVKSAAVTWGYNSAKCLKQSNPHFLIHTPADLLHIQ